MNESENKRVDDLKTDFNKCQDNATNWRKEHIALHAKIIDTTKSNKMIVITIIFGFALNGTLTVLLTLFG